MEEKHIEPSYLWSTMLIAVGLHVAFVGWIKPQIAQPVGLVPDLPQLSFYSGSGASSRALYSPVLFALPTSIGFSRSMLRQPLRSDPPVQAETDIRSMVPVEQRLAVSPPPEVFPSDRYQLTKVFKDTGSQKLSTHHLDVRVPSGLSTRLIGGEDFTEREPLVWTAFPEAGAVPWMAEFRVELHKDSRVRRVFLLDDPIKGPSSEALVRWMYQQGFQSGRPVEGRVVIRWTPPGGDS